MKNSKYVKLVENSKKRRAQTYHAVVLKTTKEEVVAIAQGPSNDSSIKQEEFDLDDWDVVPVSKDEVKHYFSLALKARDKSVLEAEFELDHERFLLNKEKEYYAEAFK